MSFAVARHFEDKVWCVWCQKWLSCVTVVDRETLGGAEIKRERDLTLELAEASHVPACRERRTRQRAEAEGLRREPEADL